jgi:pimeloyl-ACP methyl ester carboxylesterase
LVMVHGWMDVAASYQFVVDAFAQDHYIIAPDWRGYGKTQAGQVDNFWFADYMADLEFLLDHYSPDKPVNLVGHSLGGNVVMLYGGVRPERIRRLINLEGFGLPATTPDMAPGRYAKWMDELKKLHRGELDMRAYDAVSGVARRLMKTNPRLSQDKADWLAQHWAEENAEGKWTFGPAGAQDHQRPSVPGRRGAGPVPSPEHAGAGRGGIRQQPGPVVEGQIHTGAVPRAHPTRAQCGDRFHTGCRAHDAPRPAGGFGGVDRAVYCLALIDFPLPISNFPLTTSDFQNPTPHSPQPPRPRRARGSF